MQTPLEIDFQGMAGTTQIEQAIATHVAQLEKRWGRITACRIVLNGPGQHHRKGSLYDVRIRLAPPDGREVNVGRTPPADCLSSGVGSTTRAIFAEHRAQAVEYDPRRPFDRAAYSEIARRSSQKNTRFGVGKNVHAL